MSEEEEGYITNLDGPLDSVSPVPFGLLLDDQHRRNIMLAPAYKQLTEEDEDTGEIRITGLRSEYPNASAIIAAGLSTQNNLLHLTPNQALAKKMEYGVIVQLGGLPYRRKPKIRTALTSAQFAFNNTIDGMSTEGTFSILLTKLSGSIREVITGVRRQDK